MEIKLNKNQLNILGTMLGIVAGISAVLGTQDVIDKKIAGTVGGIATVCLGYVVQRPANERPTTNQEEERELQEGEENPPDPIDEFKLELTKLHHELVDAKEIVRNEVSKFLEQSTKYIEPQSLIVDSRTTKLPKPINSTNEEVEFYLNNLDIPQKVLAYLHLQEELSHLLNLPTPSQRNYPSYEREHIS